MTYLKGVVIQGEQDNGTLVNIPADTNGHLEVAVHSPKLPFGSLHTENLIPIFQSDAVYGINSQLQLAYASGSGTATAVDSEFTVSTGTTIYSQASIQSRKRLRYRAGQGFVGRCAARFTTPVNNSYQVVGFGHAEDGVFFGYKNTDFGIIYNQRAYREVRTLTITAGTAAAETLTLTLNGVVQPTIALSTGNPATRIAWEIAQTSFTAWDAYPSGSTVVFVAKSAGAKSGTYTYSTTGSSSGVFAQTKAGDAGAETFIAQTDWNGDKLDGTGPSGVTIDPTKGNVYQVGLQYLGYGTHTFQVEVTNANNNPEFVTVHQIRNPNAVNATTFGNPSFPFTMAAYSAGSTTNLAVRAGSFAGFIEGTKVLHGGRFTYFNSLTTVGATNFQALFTIINARYYGGRTNQAVINLLNVSGALKHTSPCIFYLIRNGTLAGNPNFQTLSTQSCSLWDTAATTVSYTSGEQLIATFHLGDTGEFDHHFGNGMYNAEELTLQPGEWITLAAKATTGTPSYVTGSINTREDQ